MTPRISVVVIGYNIEQYISRCIKSILAQDYADFELIFVDDGSNDNTLSVAESFRDDARVKIISQKKRRLCFRTQGRSTRFIWRIYLLH